MPSSAREEDRNSPVVRNAAPPLVASEAKMIVAVGHDHCQHLKDVLSKEDPSTMVVVMASGNQTPKPPKPRSPVIDSRLLAVACSGSWKKLQSFLSGEDRQISGDGAIGSSAMQPAFGDEEALLRESFLEGVTMDGDTFLHVLATNSDGEDLNEAGLIRRKVVSLLFTQNNTDDTPLHCAARAGNSKLVSFLIDLARGKDQDTSRVKELLETENKSKWTVLHEAVHSGNTDIVELLMKEDLELASLPKTGTSPLYLAILLENRIMAKTLYKLSRGKSGRNDRNLSYSGPNGQNALHAAVLRGKDLTEMLLGWNINLATQQDDNGSTALHLVASVLRQRDLRAIRLLLLKANPDALYQTDNNGSFPIHVAASVGATRTINDFLKESLSCVDLRDARGRTFLHVAVEKGEIWTVGSACSNRSISWILNRQDNDGDTALHLAIKKRSLRMFCSLFGNIVVHLNLINQKGETPLDIACHSLPKGCFYPQNSEVRIHRTLNFVGAKRGISRQDYCKENDIVQERQDEMHEIDQVKEGTQSLCLGSVLIATVTFGATFAMPGGYRADDHTNGGTPTLAGTYAFDAFTLANALAFTLSAMATISLMSSGSPLVHPRSRTTHLIIAYYLLSTSVTSLVAAFALGTYMMLAPVAHKSAIGVCVMSSLVLLYQKLEFAIKHIAVLPALCKRKGIVRTFNMSATSIMISSLKSSFLLTRSRITKYHVADDDMLDGSLIAEAGLQTFEGKVDP
ncbi:ankyrin repeat-containing protein At5g02620-like [Triticum dicoccoides]|uniref:ankyrin repeat-containing protein At5g02620-like n=1 Tax=Triticum dicoccoides TaxID=85692 RepID=UPI00189119B2|nr:ankyrin repeat-containing protein At5g02620-like [Triticum dicoccoides]